jgi:hypothetical protein
MKKIGDDKIDKTTHLEYSNGKSDNYTDSLQPGSS